MDHSIAKRRFRVALLGIYHESNTFIKRSTTLDDFRNGHWLKGAAIRAEYQESYHEIGGCLSVLDEHTIDVIPVMFAEATPGGMIAREAYETLLTEMLDALRVHLPVDGCLVIAHGAAVAEGYTDMDGHWLSLVRAIVGENVPIVGTLDPHANVSHQMVEATDALVAYQTNPHIDQHETGKKSAALLVGCLNKEIKPVQVLTQTPMIISIEQQHTAAPPCRDLVEKTREFETSQNMLAASLVLGFPYADVPEMGTSFITVADNSSAKAEWAGGELKSCLVSIREKCVGVRRDIYSVLPSLASLPKPVLLLDMGDNVGGGSQGDSAYLLQVMEDNSVNDIFCCIYDPVAVATASQYQQGAKLDLYFGSCDPVAGESPYQSRVELIRMSDGKFTEPAPRHGGQVNYDMGRMAIVRTAHGNTVMLTSLRIPPFSLRQLTDFGIVPDNFDVLIAKGVNAPIAAYSGVCPTILQVDTPGTTQADVTLFQFANRRRPLFPFEA